MRFLRAGNWAFQRQSLKYPLIRLTITSCKKLDNVVGLRTSSYSTLLKRALRLFMLRYCTVMLTTRGVWATKQWQLAILRFVKCRSKGNHLIPICIQQSLRNSSQLRSNSLLRLSGAVIPGLPNLLFFVRLAKTYSCRKKFLKGQIKHPLLRCFNILFSK